MEKSNRRALIVLGVLAAVVLALFVSSVVCRPDTRGPGGGCSPSQRDAWRARLLGPQPVAPGQLRGCTAAPGPFTLTGTCELKIAAADARSRRLVVEAIDPIELRRTTDADGRRITMRAKLEPGEDTQVFVGEEGETLRLRCLGGITCRARVE